MRAWTVDADDIRVAEDFDEALLHRTPEIDGFLAPDGDDKFIVIGTKGFATLGKVARDGREVWVCVRAENRIAVVDTHSLEIAASIAMPQMPIRVAMSPDGRTAYVTCAAASTLVAIDVAGRNIQRTHRVALPLAPGAPNRQFAHLGPGSPLPIGLAVSPHSGIIFLAATMSDRVQMLDPVSLDVVRSVDVGGEPDGIAVSAVRPGG